MPDRTPTDADRRRSARFSCGGQAKISPLPSDGTFVPGTIRDLSLHGCCIDTALSVEDGTRAEFIVRVNTASFRAVGEVRGIRGGSGTGVEFVQLSAGGKGLLTELVSELGRLQALMRRLRSARREMDAATFSRELQDGKLARMLSQRFPILGAVVGAESLEQEERKSAGVDLETKEQSLITPVDLFG